MPADTGCAEQAAITTPFGLFFAEGPVGFCAINLVRASQQTFALMTAYPVPLKGIERTVIVIDVKQDCFGLEGWIDAETEGGVPISFFAADYFVHPGRYSKDAVIKICLSGLIYSIDIADPQDVVITNPTTIQRYRHAGMDFPIDQPLRISTAKAAILFPIEAWDPFDYSFQGVVKDADYGTHESRDFHQLVVTVVRDRGDDVDLLLLARNHHRPDFQPTAGSVVAGRMSVMGWLADFQWPASKSASS